VAKQVDYKKEFEKLEAENSKLAFDNDVLKKRLEIKCEDLVSDREELLDREVEYLRRELRQKHGLGLGGRNRHLDELIHRLSRIDVSLDLSRYQYQVNCRFDARMLTEMHYAPDGIKRLIQQFTEQLRREFDKVLGGLGHNRYNPPSRRSMQDWYARNNGTPPSLDPVAEWPKRGDAGMFDPRVSQTTDNTGG